MLERLERRLDLLTSGLRDAPERQRTLRATLEWSHELLDEAERRLFRSLSVFAGAFSLEAAETVCRADLDTLASLVDKHLVQRTDDGLLVMLETIRAYAAEQLEGQGEAVAFRRAHGEYYLAFAERAQGELRGPGQGTWTRRIEQEHANFAAAMKFFVDSGLAASALRIGGALMPFWERGGRAAEGRTLLEPALRSPSSAQAPDGIRAWALHTAGKLAYIQDDRESERAFLEEALTLFRRSGDASGELLTEIELGWTEQVFGDIAAAKAIAEGCVERARGLGDQWVYAYSLRLWGSAVSEVGELDEAIRANRESLALFAACGDLHEQMGTRSTLGWLAIVGEDYEEAASLLNQAIAETSNADAEYFLAVNRSNLGLANVFLGNDERAVVEFSESLRLCVSLGAQRIGAESLLGVAAVAARASKSHEVARLRAASHAIREACGATINAAEERIERGFFVAANEAAGDAVGMSMNLDQAAKYAAETIATIRTEARLHNEGAVPDSNQEAQGHRTL